MDLIADFLLLAASLCACLYCWLLSQRLNKLKDTRNGIAASLASLSKSVEEAKKAIAHSHLAADESVGRLEPLVVEARQLRSELTYDLETLSQGLAAQRARFEETLRKTARMSRAAQAAAATAPDEDASDDEDAIDLDHDEDLMIEAEATPEAVDAEDSDDPAEDGDFEIEWKEEDEVADDAPKARDVISLGGAAA